MMSNKCIIEVCNNKVTTAAVCEFHLNHPSNESSGVQCGNPKHPNGAWHTDAPYPASWQYIETFRQWWRRRKYGCGCPVAPSQTLTREDSNE